MNKITPQRISVDIAGKHSRHIRLQLQGDETIAWIRETPGAFKSIQADGDKRLLRGDFLTVVSPDSLTYAVDMPVLKADATGCWLGAPSRMINFEREILYEDESFAVRPNGSRYEVFDKRSGYADGTLYATAKQAEFSIHKRQPKQSAA